MSNPLWIDSGLPAECPECGEDKQLVAFVDEEDSFLLSHVHFLGRWFQ